jgi:hypothetical protein
VIHCIFIAEKKLLVFSEGNFFICRRGMFIEAAACATESVANSPSAGFAFGSSSTIVKPL